MDLPVKKLQVDVLGQEAIPPAYMVSYHEDGKVPLLHFRMKCHAAEVLPGHPPGVPFKKGIIEPVVTCFDDHVSGSCF
jgi:hypothetical protein